MSKTDKTRPYSVQYSDPDNRCLRMIGRFGYPAEGGDEWTWKKIDPCSNSCCCYGYWYAYAHRKQRVKMRNDLRKAQKTAPQDRGDIDIWWNRYEY